MDPDAPWRGSQEEAARQAVEVETTAVLDVRGMPQFLLLPHRLPSSVSDED
jgi:hypothetical protein